MMVCLVIVVKDKFGFLAQIKLAGLEKMLGSFQQFDTTIFEQEKQTTFS